MANYTFLIESHIPCSLVHSDQWQIMPDLDRLVVKIKLIYLGIYVLFEIQYEIIRFWRPGFASLTQQSVVFISLWRDT